MSYAAEVLADSPLGYWRLGEASGTTVVDSSGNGRDGTYTGTPGLGATGALLGDSNTAAAFNANGFAAIADAAWQDVSQATLEIWFKTSNTGANYMLGRWDSPSGGHAHAYLDLQASNVIRFYINGAGTTRILSATVTGLRDGNWHHAVGTYNGSQLELFVDGTSRGTLSYVGSITAADRSVVIGARSDATTTNRFNGTLDEAAFYGSALSSTRILAHYNAALSSAISGTFGATVGRPTSALSATSTPPSFTGTFGASVAAPSSALTGSAVAPGAVTGVFGAVIPKPSSALDGTMAELGTLLLDFEDFTLGSPVAYLELQAAFGDTSITADDVAMIDLVSATIADPPTVGDRPGPTNTGAPSWLIDAYEAGNHDYDWNSPSVNSFTYTDGAVITNKVIYGDGKRPKVMNLGVKLDGCLHVGGANNPTWATAVIDCSRSDGTGAGFMEITNATIAPRNPHDGRDGIKGRQWKATACDISGTVDGVGIFSKAVAGASANVEMVGCWVHDLVYQFPDMAHDDGTHNDCCQYQGGRNVTVRGNYFEGTIGLVIGTPPTPEAVTRLAAGYCSQGIVIQDNNGAGSDATVVFEDNWLSGAITQVDIKDDMVVVYRGNIHYVDTYARHIRAAASATITGLDENVWGDGPNEGDFLTEANDGIVMV